MVFYFFIFLFFLFFLFCYLVFLFFTWIRIYSYNLYLAIYHHHQHLQFDIYQLTSVQSTVRRLQVAVSLFIAHRSSFIAHRSHPIVCIPSFISHHPTSHPTNPNQPERVRPNSTLPDSAHFGDARTRSSIEVFVSYRCSRVRMSRVGMETRWGECSLTPHKVLNTKHQISNTECIPMTTRIVRRSTFNVRWWSC